MMAGVFKREWSERQKVVAILVLAGAVIFLLWFFLLAPLNLRRRRLESEIGRMRTQLAQQNYLVGEDVLEQHRREAEEEYRRLFEEWTATVDRMSGLPPPDGNGGVSVGAIDYKVTLFEVRERLTHKAREARIRLPRDLGMEEAVRSNEDARRRMLQLRAVEQLVDMVLDLRIRSVRSITALEPRRHSGGAGKGAVWEEYPVAIEFHGDLGHLFALFQAAFQQRPVFVLRRARIMDAPQGAADLLRVEAEVSALVFLRAPEVLTAPPSAPPPPRPLGI